MFDQIGFNWYVTGRQATIPVESEEMRLNDMELGQLVNTVVMEDRLPINYVIQGICGVVFSCGAWLKNIRGRFGDNNWL